MQATELHLDAQDSLFVQRQAVQGPPPLAQVSDCAAAAAVPNASEAVRAREGHARHSASTRRHCCHVARQSTPSQAQHGIQIVLKLAGGSGGAILGCSRRGVREERMQQSHLSCAVG